MVKYENLANPPIQEALIDFRVRLRSSSKDDFAKLSAVLSDRYQEGKEILLFNATFNLKDGQASSDHQSNFVGFRFESKANNFVFQAQSEGFTLSKLKPYRDWIELLAEAKRVWAIYRELLNPLSVERIACRYINRFEADSNVFDFSDYFTAPPEVPKILPQGVSRYLLQLEVPAPNADATVVVTQALEGVTSAPAAFVLDIDVFKVKSYEMQDEAWWDDLEQLRDLKNQFFFESLTKKTKDMFK